MSSYQLEILAGDEVHEGVGFSGMEVPVIIVGVEQGPLAEVTPLGHSLITANDAAAALLVLGIGASGSPSDAEVANLLADVDSATRIALETILEAALEAPDFLEAYITASN